MDDARPRCTCASVSVIHRWRRGRWRRGHSNRKLPPTPISVRKIPTDQVRQYPFEFAKTRVQLRNQTGAVSPKNPFLVVGQVFRNEGVRALYKGCSTLVVVCVISEPCPISRNASCSIGADRHLFCVTSLLLRTSVFPPSILIVSFPPKSGFRSQRWCPLPSIRLHQKRLCGSRNRKPVAPPQPARRHVHRCRRQYIRRHPHRAYQNRLDRRRPDGPAIPFLVPRRAAPLPGVRVEGNVPRLRRHDAQASGRDGLPPGHLQHPQGFRDEPAGRAIHGDEFRQRGGGGDRHHVRDSALRHHQDSLTERQGREHPGCLQEYSGG